MEAAALTLVCLLSIRDNVRAEAADAIREVRNAGIQVVMVTGDRKETAAVFAAFMMAITFNGFNARTSHLNDFEGLGRIRNFGMIRKAVMGRRR